MADIKAGIYKAKVVKGSDEFDDPQDGKAPSLRLRVRVPDLQRELTVVLYLTEKAWDGTASRLRACGWKGSDLSDLTGIDENDIEIQVRYEEYQGAQKMKVDIYSGNIGTFSAKNPPTDKKQFAAKISAMLGLPPPAGAPKPNF